MRRTEATPSGAAGSVVIAACLAFVAALAGAPARADWLVTRDGARVETKGTWEV